MNRSTLSALFLFSSVSQSSRFAQGKNKQVNGIFPNYGCSQYDLQDGDVICWVYTCDLGRDVGDAYWRTENQ